MKKKTKTKPTKMKKKNKTKPTKMKKKTKTKPTKMKKKQNKRRKNKPQFNPFTQCKYTCSPYFFLYISQAADKETFMNNQELLQWAIISFIVMKLVVVHCGSGMIL